MHYTRREWNGLVAGGLLAAPLLHLSAAQASSRIAGVRVGTQSYSFRDRSLDEAIAGMRAVGLSYCELWSGHVETRTAIPSVEGVSRREAIRKWRLNPATVDYFKDIRRRFDAAGITPTSYDIGFGNDFTDEEIDAVFGLGKALGVSRMTSSTQVSLAPRLEPHAAKAGITLGFHNHSNLKPDEVARPEDFETILKAGSHLGITLDIGHFTAAGFDPLPFLDEHHERIVAMHIKDAKRSIERFVPFGEGDASIAAVLKRLRDRKWDIPAHIEYEYRGEGTDAEMKRLFAFCRQVLEEK